jgi:3-oxoacyl-[acyl-carrier protein] reductase
MDLQLAGKRALVTGSSSGIGEGAARALAAEGVAVAVHGRDEARTRAVADSIHAAGGTAVVAIGDLTDDDGAAHVCSVVDDELGGVDILFNNAGGGGTTRTTTTSATPAFLDLEPIDWLSTYTGNVVTAVRMIRHFAPQMAEQRYGRIIMNASAVATMPRDTMNDYSASKAAIVNLACGLAKALAGTGVTVNTVSPGLILTPQKLTGETWLHGFAASKGWDTTLPLEELDRLWAADRGIPSGCSGRVEHVAAVVSLLASPLGSFINGANIRVDGGQNQSVN